MPLTARQIAAKTPQGRRYAAEFVKVTSVKMKRHPNKISLIIYAKTKSSRNASGEPKPGPLSTYVSSIEIMDNRGRIKASCSCPDFLFTWEYALWAKGSADIEYSNGEPPLSRNPGNVPGCCKHLYGMFTKLISQGRL